MPRPRVIRIKDGQVVIKNLPKEVADKIEKFVTSVTADNREVVFNESEYSYELVENTDPFRNSTLNESAFGFISDPTGNFAVEVKYDPDTKMGKVEKKEVLNKNPVIAKRDFELLILKKFT